jgi:CcmD family protein
MDTFPNLAAAYTIFWLIIAFYVLRLQRRQKELRHDIESLRQRLGES